MQPAWAQEETVERDEAGDAVENKSPSSYVDLKPACVVNYGGKGKLRAHLSLQDSNETRTHG